MKVFVIIKHSVCVLFPALLLLGIYAVLFSGDVLTRFALDAECESLSNLDSSSKEEDVFVQNATFSDAEIQAEIRNCKAVFSAVSPRVGAQVQVKVPSGETPSNLTTASQQESVLEASSTVASTLEADIWRIETSYASHYNPSTTQFRRLVFYRLNGNRWESQPFEVFRESHPVNQPVIFYVHGNRTEVNTAVMQGMQVLKNCPTEIPARLVIWTWDSNRVSNRPRVEYPTKALYADFQGFYLADLIRGLESETQVLLVGHSFGARTVLSSLHLLAGGTFSRRTLESTFPSDSEQPEVELGSGVNVEKDVTVSKALPELNVLLVASAVSCNVLEPNGLYSQALEPISEMYVTQNPSDPALKFYPMMNGRRSPLPEALGYVGPVLNRTEAELREKVRVIRLNYPTHQFLEYISMRSVQGGLQL